MYLAVRSPILEKAILPKIGLSHSLRLVDDIFDQLYMYDSRANETLKTFQTLNEMAMLT